MRVVLAAIALLLSACSEEPPDPVTAARQVIESAPNDPAPRIALARLYLERGRGDLAEVLLNQAVERGASALELLPERAEALRIGGRIAALRALPIPEEPAARARVLASRAMAEPSDDTFKALYIALDDVDLPEVRAIADAQQASRRARTHHDCAKAVPRAVYTWDHPLTTTADAFTSANDSPPVERKRIVVPVRSVAELQEAARKAPDGATIEIDAKDYPGAVAEFRQNDLTVRGIHGRPHITASGRSVAKRDAWLFSGNDVTVANVEISGARAVQDKNGASIRFIGRNLTLRSVYLHDSENGLLTGNGHPDSRILIEYSEFARNGDGEGYAHNLYIGVSGELAFRYSYSHESKVGHLLKSRAAGSVVAYSYLADHESGTSSRSIDLPDGGRALVIGNVIDHGANSVNKTIIGYGTETSRYEDNALQVVNNTFYNRYLNAVAIDNRRVDRAFVINNLFAGAPLVRLEGAGNLEGNIDRVDHGLTDPNGGDYSIAATSPAVDTGVETSTFGIDQPAFEYVHPASVRTRETVWSIDAGAYERCGF